jgi:hypothetical protein
LEAYELVKEVIRTYGRATHGFLFIGMLRRFDPSQNLGAVRSEVRTQNFAPVGSEKSRERFSSHPKAKAARARM